MCALLPTCAFSQRLTDTADDWLCYGQQYRLAVASELAIVAGQGLSKATDAYFFSCIDEYASSLDFGSIPLKSLGASCAFLLAEHFAETD
jgi:hypothetical protein